MNIKIFSYIVSSIIGTGIFILPNTIIPCGWSSIVSLILSSCVFFALGYVLSKSNRPIEDMYEQIPNTKLNDIVSLGYWIISWSSTIVIFYEMAQPLYYLIFSQNPTQMSIIIIQLCLTFGFIGLQLLGTNKINKIEVVLTVCKILSAVIIPIIFLTYYLTTNTITTSIAPVSLDGIFNTFPSIMWMFLGIECCSLIQGNKKTQSMVYAISTISIIYLLNFLAILLTMTVNGTYQDIMSLIFQKTGRKIMSIIIVILCFGSSNSWFTASTVTLQALSDRGTVSPKFLSYRTSMLASSIGLIPLSIIVSNPNAKIVFANILDGFSIITAVFYIFITYAISKKYNQKLVGYAVMGTLSVFTIYNLINIFNKLIMYTFYS